MSRDWSDCKNILVIRADNMGDLIMSTPAIRALKKSFGAKITVLTSSMAKGIAKMIPEIDEVLVYDIPWVKTSKAGEAVSLFKISELLKGKAFDGAVIFTVCSQNPLPAAMIAYMAGITRTLAFCRENPYQLISDWIPDEEPYHKIQHQVKRDLELVKHTGTDVSDESLSLATQHNYHTSVHEKLKTAGVDANKPYLIFHPGVSEEKRRFAEKKWVKLVNSVAKQFRIPILLTGTESEKPLTDAIKEAATTGAYSLAGLFSLEEFVTLIQNSQLVVSVNTGTIHIAAAFKIPVIVFYALTNPQHLPWRTRGKAFYFDVPAESQSKNQVIQFMHHSLMQNAESDWNTEELLKTIETLLKGGLEEFPELVPLK